MSERTSYLAAAIIRVLGDGGDYTLEEIVDDLPTHYDGFVRADDVRLELGALVTADSIESSTGPDGETLFWDADR